MTLEELYKLHVAGELGQMDPRWEQVHDDLRGVAVSTVRSVTSRTGAELYGPTMEERVDDVHTALLGKFVTRRLDSSTSFNAVVMTAARNSLLDAFRRSSSPCATGFDGAERTWQQHERPTPKDLFLLVRQRLRPFRFGEFPHVREALLAHFLTHHNFPGAGFLAGFGVHQPVRGAVYNAAVYDLNTAMTEVCQA